MPKHSRVRSLFTPTVLRRALAALTSGAALAACSGGGDGDTSPAPLPTVNSVTVSPSTATLHVGQTLPLGVQVAVSNGAATTVTWTAEPASVASVSSLGVVTALAPGTATIRATSTVNAARSGSATIVVHDTRRLSLTPAVATIGVGQNLALTANVQLDPGMSTAVTWTSASPDIAAVNQNGVITGVSRGSTHITAVALADTTVRAQATITVTPLLATEWNATRLQGALHEDVVSLYVIDDNTAYAVNSLGDIFRWNGLAWSLSTTGSAHGTRFTAVDGSSAINVIAVGTGGRIVRFNGSTWTAMASSTSDDLLGVHVRGRDSAWAVGMAGATVHLSDAGWTLLDAGTAQDLYDVWADDEVVYVVGTGGTVQRRVDGVWSSLDMPTSETFYGVHGVSPADVVVVGEDGAVLRWDGTQWITINTAIFPGGFYAVTGSAANNGRRYIAADVGVAQLDGFALTPVSTPYAPPLYTITTDANGNVWTGGQRGLVMRGAASWSTLNLAPDLLDVWSTAANNAFAVGEFGFVYRWNGSEWLRLPTPTQENLNTVWAADASHALAGGDNGAMLQWNGTSWSPMTFPSTGHVYGMWGGAANDVYAVTSLGEILHWNGSTWTRTTQAANSLWGVFGTVSATGAITRLMAVGEHGTVMRFNGSTWTPSVTPAGGTLAGVWLASDSMAVVVGADASGAHGVAWQFDGTTWREGAPASLPALTSVWGTAPHDLYATGDAGTLLHFNGRTWRVLSSGTSDLLWAISGAPDGLNGAMAVGYNSTVVWGSNPAPAGASPTQRQRQLQRQMNIPMPQGASGAVRAGTRRALEPMPGVEPRRGPLPSRTARHRTP